MISYYYATIIKTDFLLIKPISYPNHTRCFIHSFTLRGLNQLVGRFLIKPHLYYVQNFVKLFNFFKNICYSNFISIISQKHKLQATLSVNLLSGYHLYLTNQNSISKQYCEVWLTNRKEKLKSKIFSIRNFIFDLCWDGLNER